MVYITNFFLYNKDKGVINQSEINISITLIIKITYE